MASRKRENKLYPEAVEITCRSGGYCTKKELASRKLPMSCPPVPPKVRRGMGSSRTLFTVYGKAKAIAARNDGATPPLSPLYNKRQKKSYLDQLFDFRIQIGEGCFGYVYKAISSEDRKCYAIKYLKENAGTPASKKSEIRNYSRIGSCDYIVNFIRAWEEHERYYIQMEYCVTSLAAFAAEHHTIPEGQLWDILTDMLLALKYLHGNNYIHLDIKPENIMISQQGIYKLGDFGLLANLKEIKDGGHRVLNLSEGDSKYLASEVLEGVYTTACDVFSLGVTILELSTDLVLPPNGTLWHELRNGVFPELFFHRVGDGMIRIVQLMMLHNYELRPSVEWLLKFRCVENILKERNVKPRINYLLNPSRIQLVVPMRGNDIPDQNMNNVVDENANGVAEPAAAVSKSLENAEDSEDDGVAPLSPLKNLVKEDTECPYQPVSSPNPSTTSNCGAAASTSSAASNVSEVAASPASSDTATPPSSNNKSIVFSPIRTRERRMREDRAIKSGKGRKLFRH